jgi:hypothetical protein
MAAPYAEDNRAGNLSGPGCSTYYLKQTYDQVCIISLALLPRPVPDGHDIDHPQWI